MRLETLLGAELKDRLASDPQGVQRELEEFRSEDIAETLEQLEPEVAIALISILPEDFAADVLEHVEENTRSQIFEALGTDRAASVLSVMPADERTDALQELSEDFAEKILDKIEETEPEVAEETRQLGSYPEHSAGGIMTTEFVSLSPETKVWQAIDEVRRISQEHVVGTITYIYVLAYGDQLVGVVSLRDLILSDTGKALADVMAENVVRVLATDDQEEVAQTIQKYDFSALPVVDPNGKMLGVVTVDDLVDVVVQEATEDAQRMGAVVPTEDPYFDTAFWTFVKKRAGWLIALFLGELLTSNVMRRYETDMAAVIDLVIFVPLILSSGGNSGSQSSSLIIRALAVGEVRPRDWIKVFRREAGMGIALGLILGAVGFARVFFLGQVDHTFAMSIAVATSLIAIVTMGTLTGSLLPMLIKKLGFDPAVSSTPFIASLVDVVGLIVYFTIASSVLSLLS